MNVQDRRTEQFDTPYELSHQPDYAFLKLQLQAGQTVQVEASAMASMDRHLTMKTKVKGGLLKGVKRMLGGESLFINEFSAEQQPGELYVAPATPGDVQHYYLNGNSIFLQSSAFVAAGMGVNLDSKWQGFKGFFNGESLFLLRATGQGDLWFSTYGAVLEIPVTGNYVVDTGYIVAFEDSLDYSVEFVGGLKTSLFGGEGLVCRFRGQGRVWVQTRQLVSFLRWLHPYRPVKSND
ncbi:TIGR00266 family protein [Leptolyngbya sp. FACHB-261]|uniref:TIGR00266 family protein n=1 Tax=Leptolyngbya sp. FACHB-261 TaxID=2692806 RepID=UPI00168A2E09|nr:TIGR00266 family protein [Leptolyngbya sp. FACHB-261]MBD2102455.1 TIGR00266 family protein [Leptolyngbya sp. FACHB-261]